MNVWDIYEYIALELLAPETATGQTRRIMKTIRSLGEMPMRYQLYGEEPWHSRGISFLPVDNYLIFYLPEEPAGLQCEEVFAAGKTGGLRYYNYTVLYKWMEAEKKC